MKSTVGPAMFAAAPPTQSICATFLPARSAALAIVSACSTPAAENAVFDHLERVVDSFDDIANEIEGIVVEHV